MRFDIVTLYFADVAVLLAAAAAAFLAWRKNHDEVGLEEWAIAMAIGGAGAFILARFGPVLGMALSILANGLVVAALGLVWESLRRFNGRPAENARVVVLTAGYLAIFSLAWFLGADLRWRVALTALAFAALAVLASREVAVGGRPEGLSGRTATAVIFAVVAVDMLIRATDAVLAPPHISDSDFVGDPILVHTVVATTVSLACLGIGGLSTMAHERALARYEWLAQTDELTGLPNRRYFFEHGARMARRAAMNGAPACILGVDLDHFSSINTRFGHAGGDRALVAFARVLSGQIRPTDLAARSGGEEFCVFLADTDDATGARIAERLCAAVAAQTIDMGDGKSATITVSIGLAALQADDLAAAMERADQALYKAKHAGRNRVVVADH
jgi:diguanylate cyclase (GGDEF)-like protein